MRSRAKSWPSNWTQRRTACATLSSTGAFWPANCSAPNHGSRNWKAGALSWRARSRRCGTKLCRAAKNLPGLFGGLCRVIVDDSRRLVSALASVLASLGHGEVFSLIEPKEKEATRTLKLELLQGEAKRTEEEMEKARFGLHAHRAELESLPAGEAAAAKTGLSEQQTKQRQAREALKERIAALEEKFRREELSQRTASTSTATLEIALAKLEGELTGLSERLLGDYSLSLQEIAAAPQTVANAGKTRSEIDAGKARMRELEPVNLLAIEEYEKTRERLTFIEAQLARP